MALPVNILEDVDSPLSAALKLAQAANELYMQVAGATLNASQWLANEWTPEYLGADSFRLTGDLTGELTTGRAMRSVLVGGAAVSHVAGAVFDGEYTTITLAGEVLDATLSAVQTGILTPANSALPEALTNLNLTQWLAKGWEPEYLAADSFRLTGDLTGELLVGRAVRCTLDGGPVVSHVAEATAGGGYTTVTLAGELLDASLSAVEPGILTPANSALPDTVALLSQVALPGDVAPVGSVVMWATENIPTGWLPLDGRELSRTEYAALFAVLGGRYGGNGSTTFRLPDARGLFPRFVDSGAGLDPDAAARTNRGDGTTGNQVGTKQGDQLRSHSHGMTKVPATNAQTRVPDQDGKWVADHVAPYYVTSTNAQGGNETRPANIYLWPIIKAGV